MNDSDDCKAACNAISEALRPRGKVPVLCGRRGCGFEIYVDPLDERLPLAQRSDEHEIMCEICRGEMHLCGGCFGRTVTEQAPLGPWTYTLAQFVKAGEACPRCGERGNKIDHVLALRSEGAIVRPLPSA